MKTEMKCVVAEMVCEGFIGATIGTVVSKTVLPKCNAVESVVVMAGSGVIAWSMGRAFGKQFYKACDEWFGTSLGEIADDVL